MQATDTPSTAASPPRPGTAPAVAPRAGRERHPRTLQLVQFLAAAVWYLCARAISATVANVLALRFDLSDTQPLIYALLLLFLVVVGLSLLRSMEDRSIEARAPLRTALGLPKRVTSREEWTMGAALGWGLAVAAVLPMALTRSLNVQLWTAPHAFYLLGLSLLTLAAATLAHALAIYGFGFQRLIAATGPVRATLFLIFVLAAAHATVAPPYGTPEGTRVLVDMLMTLLLCLCWLRTHGVWLLWGLNFAWAASTAVLFGLPIAGDASFGSVVDTRAAGQAWLTGGAYGPAAAAFSILVLLAAIPVLVRVTRDYAWDYTHLPIVPGGYDVTIAPPAAHAAMEQAAATASASSLVQIQPLQMQQAAPSIPAADSVPE